MVIERATLSAVHDTLRAAYPDEGCGFLLGSHASGTEAIVCRHIPVENRRRGGGAARNRYLIGPEDFLAAERAAAAAGIHIIGTYHSHPDAPAGPSEYDGNHAWPRLYYLIASVVFGRVQNTRVWELVDDRSGFTEHALHIKEA